MYYALGGGRDFYVSFSRTAPCTELRRCCLYCFLLYLVYFFLRVLFWEIVRNDIQHVRSMILSKLSCIASCGLYLDHAFYVVCNLVEEDMVCFLV